MSITLGKTTVPTPTSAPSLSTLPKNKSNQATETSRGQLCTHCGKSDHSKQRCYKMIGYSNWWDFTKKPWRNIGGKTMMTSRKVEQVQPTTNVSYPSILGKASVLFVTSKYSAWTINTCASNHMSRYFGHLKSLNSPS